MGGKRPRQSDGVLVLPDDAGVASVAERHTRETDVLRLSKTHRLEPGGSGPEATRTRLPHHGGGELPDMSAGGWGGRGDVLRGSHGDVAGVESDASSAERSISEHGNRPWICPLVRVANVAMGAGHTVGQTGQGRGGAVVVVRGRESRSHGEGRQWFREEIGGCNAERRGTEW
jgi:hypothetical protein